MSGRGRPPSRPRLGSLGWGLLAVGLVARLAWAFVAPTDLWFDLVWNDATAWSLVQGHGFTVSLEAPFEPAIFRTPGYSTFLAGVYGLAGHSVRAAFIAQAFVDTATCALLWSIAARRLDARAARFTLLLAVSYPFTLHTVGKLSAEVPLVFLATLLLAVVDRWPDRGGRRGVAAVGLVLAALVWIKPIFLPLPAFLLVAELLRGRTWRVAVTRSIAVGAVAVVAFAPWVVRNAQEFGRPLLAGEVGLVLFHGTLDFDAERDTIIREAFAAAPAADLDRYEAARRSFADPREVLRRDREHLDDALERMRTRPFRAALLDPLRRLPRLWVSTTYAIGPAWIGVGAAIACIAYLLLGAVGLRRLWDRRRELAAWWIAPVALTLAYAAFHVEARYTLPARPTMLLLGGAALASLTGRRKPTRAAAPSDTIAP